MLTHSKLARRGNRWLNPARAASVVVALVLATGGATGAAADEFAESIRALQGGKFAAAAKALESQLQTAPANSERLPDLYFYLGIARHLEAENLAKTDQRQRSQQLWSEAREALQKASTLRETSPGTWNNLALVHERLEEFDKARTAFRRAIDLGGGDQASYLANYGDLLRRQERYDDALRMYLEAAALDPSSVRLRDSILALVGGPLRNQQLAVIWRLYDHGELQWSHQLCVAALRSDVSATDGAQLLTCVALGLARDNSNAGWEWRAKSLAEIPADSKFSGAIQQLLDLRNPDRLQPSSFSWWSRQVDGTGKRPPPRGGWPQAAFSQVIRALGAAAESRDDDRLAERYYRLSYNLTPHFLDPVALIKLADLWMKRADGRDRLLSFLANEEQRVFSEKGDAILKANLRRTYEIHRALAQIYVHVDRWESSEPFHNAEAQLRLALSDAAKFNRAVAESPGLEPIADWESVDKLATHYASSGRMAAAVELRVASIAEFKSIGKGAEASNVLMPILESEVPADLKADVGEQLQDLRKNWKLKGLDAFLTPDQTRARVPLGPAPDQGAQILVDPTHRLSPAEVRQLRDLFRTHADDHSKLPDAPRRGGRPPVRMTPALGDDQNIERLKFDGKKGSVSLKRGDDSVQIPFSIQSAEATPAIRPFNYVKP